MSKINLSNDTIKRFEDFKRLVFELRYITGVKEIKVSKEFYHFLRFYKDFLDAFENDKINPIDYNLGNRNLYCFGVKIFRED